jgi:hypothetical protein
MDKIAFRYKLSALNVLSSFKVVKNEKKKTLKYLIYAVIFIILAVVWLISYIQNPSSVISIIVAVVCFSFAMITFYLPSRNRKEIALSVEKAENEFYMEFSDGTVFFTEDHSDSVSQDACFFYETDCEFVIDAGGDKVFCAPKEYLTGEQVEGLRKMLSENSDRFFDKRKHLEEK